MAEEFILTEEILENARAREQNYRFTLETERRHEQLFEPFGVSFHVFRVLSYLLLHPDGAAPSQIADDLLILRQSMTNLLDGLEKKGLVRRMSDPRDRRRLIVELLPEGRALETKLLEMEEDFSRRINQRFSAEELAYLRRLDREVYEAKVAALNEILSERGE